jgi:signal transduction histidine kinase
MEKDGYMINISGRQRFLSQQIALLALQYVSSRKQGERHLLQEKLVQCVNEMEAVHSLLAHDSVSISSHYHFPAVDSIYYKAPVFLDEKMNLFLYHAIVLGEFEYDTLTTENIHLKYLLASSSNLLYGLDQVVNEYQEEYEEEVATNAYRRNLLAAGSLIAYILIGLLIFRPMTNKIYNTLTDLENKEEEVQRINLTHVASIIDAQEMERQRIASDLHDGLIQTLTIIAYKFDVENKKPNLDAYTNYYEAKTLISNAINETRNIAYSILPPLLKEFGLVPALNSLAEEAKANGNINIDFQTFNFSERLEDRLELTLYRIAQEALNNIIKYAEAKNVLIQLIRHPNSLVLIIEDDGKGFDTSRKFEQKGIGIINMQDRIKVFHGNFVIHSSSEMGTEIMAEVPLNNSSNA